MSPYRVASPPESSEDKISLWHRIEHRFGWFYVHIETYWENEDLMVRSRCVTCGRVGQCFKALDDRFMKD